MNEIFLVWVKTGKEFEALDTHSRDRYETNLFGIGMKRKVRKHGSLAFWILFLLPSWLRGIDFYPYIPPHSL